jgi:hypothetical protein
MALTALANAALIVRGPGQSLGISVLLILACGAGLGWFIWEQRNAALVGRVAVLVVSTALLFVATAYEPTESHDVWSYVMYGRTVAVHHSNPYEHPPSAFHSDPLRPRVDPVWRHARSIYGPVFVAIAAVSVRIAGDSPQRSRTIFQAEAALAALACLLLVDHLTRGDPRAIAFVGLNQLVVVTTVNNAHNDIYVGLAALGAVVLVRRRPAMAGAILGLAALVKVAALMPAGVLAVWLWRRRERVGALLLAGAAGAVTAAGYLAAGTSSLTVLSAARDRMNRGSLWYPVREIAAHMMAGAHAKASAVQHARDVVGPRISTISTLAVVALALLIAIRARREPPMIIAAAVIAYAVLGAYILPWYIVWGVPVLALVWQTRMAWLAVALAFFLELAYVPDDRRIGIFKEPQIHTWLQRAQADLRVVGVPILELTAIVALVVWSAGRAQRRTDDETGDAWGAPVQPAAALTALTSSSVDL